MSSGKFTDGQPGSLHDPGASGDAATETSPHEPPTRREYQAEAVGTGPVTQKGCESVRVVLGSLKTPYLGIVMRWVGAQAHRIADGLDPAPDVWWLKDKKNEKKSKAIRALPLPEWAPDVPAELRAWCADRARRQEAYERLRAGWPFMLSAADHTGVYTVWVVPVDVPADERPDEPPIRAPEHPPTRVQRHRKARTPLRWLPRCGRANAGHRS
ncbi:hypothetical protein [Streptomyces sp. NRRL B-1347]|uniref:hypothetical protein n=1 Tax=Streptomyces sp. NRRL B-1347 TaxID=1476877 RepID=UPI00131B4B21|nr:hypothetical protein [Streptomyces sp. NRRL B-1347]